MIDDYLGGEDWDEPPAEMALEMAYGDILDSCISLAAELREENPRASEPAEAIRLAQAALRLYIRVPALVNVALNYKICVEHGLPLHPTVYYELAEARRYKMDHSMAQLERANSLYVSSIELARAAYRLDADFAEKAAAFRSSLPE